MRLLTRRSRDTRGPSRSHVMAVSAEELTSVARRRTAAADRAIARFDRPVDTTEDILADLLVDVGATESGMDTAGLSRVADALDGAS